MQLCEYGCGRKATYQFKNGKWCCSKSFKQCPESRKKTSIQVSGKNHPLFGKISPIRGRISPIRLTIKEIQERYQLLSKIEEMRYNPDKPIEEREIQVRCKNHKCKNSKRQNGWFVTTTAQIYERNRALTKYNSSVENSFYCSEYCKQSCDLYGKRVSQLMITENDCQFPYTQLEYKTWRDEVFKRANNECEYCGELVEEAHHSKPQKLYPGLALDPDYGIASCKKCHYKKGHTDRECTYGYIAQQ